MGDQATVIRRLGEGWPVALAVFGLSLPVLGFAFWTTYTSIVSIWWRSGTFTHGFMILPIVGYLIWHKRAGLAAITPRPEPRALVVIAGAALLWLLSHTADVAVVEQLAAVAMIPTLVWTIFGTPVASFLAFPLGYLIFAVPMGEFLVPSLQDITAAFSVKALQLTGIPVYWEGRFFYIPTGSFEVAEACSGVRYLIASLALGTLYAYLSYTTFWRRLLFVTLSALVPVAANGIRAYGIVMLAHLSDYKLAVGVDHIIYGWLFFGVVIMGLFWVGTLFREKDAVETTIATVAIPTAVASGRYFTVWMLMAIFVAVSAPGLAAWLESRMVHVPVIQPELPVGRNGWSGPYPDESEWRPSFSGAIERRGEYQKDGKKVAVYLAYYPTQAQGAELINSQNMLFDSKGSRRLAEADSQIALDKGLNWQIHATQVIAGDKSRLIWHWYEVDGKATANYLLAKAYEVSGRLSGSSMGSAAWIISTQYDITPSEAEETLFPFVVDMLPALRESLGL